MDARKVSSLSEKQLQLFITVFYCFALSLELANIIFHVIMDVRLLRLSFKEVVKLDQFAPLGALVCGVSRFKAI